VELFLEDWREKVVDFPFLVMRRAGYRMEVWNKTKLGEW
jgi:hypothetical protein